MLRWLMVLFLAVCAATPVLAAKHAQATPAPAPANLSGEYHLDGVMETGSGLLLRDDNTFAWFFSYGALDLFAKGKWQRAGDGIDLVVEDMAFPDQMPEMKFERMHLRIDGNDLVPSWPWDMDAFRKGAERGAYSRSE
ncbi:hypothetical protein LYSHEL_08170 [Lysobacter helvus]|uniref:Uncharacterized protein n=2 Tax=Lysobacteraceae TaxID=32033 RepID=A0ABN6FQB2_9GAMM|nr:MULTISPECIES: hypothetical protein [Lysobacter]BCT91793.1 hypothetical protein LYSCAS_08170 [Lysobacter caseinilyticus]BCT94946.1 hypothetical protein LYSHEL_08170 [Lysobacter helvus]